MALTAEKFILPDGAPAGTPLKQKTKSSSMGEADLEALNDERDAQIHIALVNNSNSVLSITPGTPVSPSSPEIALIPNYTPKNASYDGNIEFVVTKKQAVCATFAFSVSASLSNVVMTGYVYVGLSGGTLSPISQHTHRAISSAGDVGAASMQGVVVLDPGTYELGFYVDVDKACNITIYEGASWGLRTGCYQ